MPTGIQAGSFAVANRVAVLTDGSGDFGPVNVGAKSNGRVVLIAYTPGVTTLAVTTTVTVVTQRGVVLLNAVVLTDPLLKETWAVSMPIVDSAGVVTGENGYAWVVDEGFDVTIDIGGAAADGVIEILVD